MIGDLDKTTGIVRYSRADADKLRAELEQQGVGSHIIRTELFDYAQELGVMIAYTDRPGFEVLRFRGRQFDAAELAAEILDPEQ